VDGRIEGLVPLAHRHMHTPSSAQPHSLALSVAAPLPRSQRAQDIASKHAQSVAAAEAGGGAGPDAPPAAGGNAAAGREGQAAGAAAGVPAPVFGSRIGSKQVAHSFRCVRARCVSLGF